MLADAGKATHAQVSWDHSTPEMLYTLTVNCSTVKERRGWERGKAGDMVAPEWCLYQIRENGKDRVDLWRMASGDTAIIMNLLEDSRFAATTRTDPLATAEFPTVPRDDVYSSQNASQSTSQQLHTRSFQHPEPETISLATQIDRTSSGVNLSGELREVDVASILQSISLCKMTGRLNVYDTMKQIEIFFSQGELVHAISSQLMDSTQSTRGERVLLEVFSWDEGSFQFQHGWQTTEKSVNKHLQNLVLEGATIRDYKNFLDKSGIAPSTVLQRAETNLSESQFEAKLANGLPLYVDFQKKVFLALREPRSLEEVLTAVPMEKITWIPVIFSLLTSKLISARGGANNDLDVDQCAATFSNISELIRNADRGLLQPDSGMLSYGLFLSMTEKELARRVPFCLAMFEFSVPAGAITNEALKAVTTTFDTIKKPYELMTFWHPNRMLMLLPMSKSEDSHDRLNRFLDMLEKQTDMDGISLTCGLAHAPKDGTQLTDVLAASLRLLKKSQQNSARITTSA